VLSGLSISNICFGDNPLSSTKINERYATQEVIAEPAGIKYRIKSRVRSIKGIPTVRKYIRKIKNPDFRTTVIKGAALVGGGLAACMIPALVKVLSRYFEVNKNMGDFCVNKMTNGTMVPDLIKTSSLYLDVDQNMESIHINILYGNIEE